MTTVDSDGEEDDFLEYYYDLVIRAPETEDLLTRLRASRAIVVWKRRMTCRLLNSDEIDSLTDADVVDWHDFHREYLDSLSRRRASTANNATERGHDHIDDLEQLTDVLKEQYPNDFVDTLGDKKKNERKIEEWQSCVIYLAMEYQRLLNIGLQNDGVVDLPTRIRDILGSPWSPIDLSHSETIFYIGGAVSIIIRKMGNRSKDKYSAILIDIQSNSSTTKELARENSLPLCKVEAKEVVNLCYINEPFFDFVNKIESVFHTLLSEGNIALYGSAIVADITHALSKEDLDIKQFLTKSYDNDDVDEVLRRIIWSYGRLRGKDFVRKCNAKVGVHHHETLRSSLGTASAIAAKNTNKGKGRKKSSDVAHEETTDEEKTPRWVYLIKQRKIDLQFMCKNRKLHYSGTKKVLARRVIEYDAKQKTTMTVQHDTDVVAKTTTYTAGEDQYLQEIINDMEKEADSLIEYFQEYNSK